MFFTLRGLELSCNGGSFSGKNVDFRFSRRELNNDALSVGVRQEIVVRDRLRSELQRRQLFRRANLSRKLLPQGLPERSRPAASGPRFDGLRCQLQRRQLLRDASSERMLSASDCQTDLLSSAGGRKLSASWVYGLGSCTGGKRGLFGHKLDSIPLTSTRKPRSSHCKLTATVQKWLRSQFYNPAVITRLRLPGERKQVRLVSASITIDARIPVIVISVFEIT